MNCLRQFQIRLLQLKGHCAVMGLKYSSDLRPVHA